MGGAAREHGGGREEGRGGGEVELLRVIFRKLGNLPALSAEIVAALTGIP